jgi:hypothetical protein
MAPSSTARAVTRPDASNATRTSRALSSTPDAEHLVDDDARLDPVSLRLHGPGARGRDHRDQTDHGEGIGEEPAEAWGHGVVRAAPQHVSEYLLRVKDCR